MAHAATQPGMTIKPAEYQVPSVYSAGLHRHTPPRQGGIFGIATALPTRPQQPPAAGTRRGGVTPRVSAHTNPRSRAICVASWWLLTCAPPNKFGTPCRSPAAEFLARFD